MGGPQTELTQLGRRIKEALDGRRGVADDIGVARSGFMEALAEGTRRHWWEPTRVRVLALLGVVVAALLGYRLLSPRSPITFEVGLEGERGVLHEAVSAPASDTLRLPFSDGSSALLGPGARMRVLLTTASGARLLLEGGESALDVRGVWRLEAGPFSVETRDAHFKARWMPGSEVLNLEVHEGSLEISGDSLIAPRKLLAGEELALLARRDADWTAELVPAQLADPLLDLLLETDTATPQTAASTR